MSNEAQAIDPVTGRKLFDQNGNPLPFQPRFEEDNPLAAKIDANLRKIPGAKSLQVIANRANMNTLQLLDFLGTDTINEILSLSGSATRLPSLSETAQQKLGIGVDLQGNYDQVLGQGNEVLGRALELGTDLGQTAVPGGAGTRAAAASQIGVRGGDDFLAFVDRGGKTGFGPGQYSESAGQGVLRELAAGGNVQRDFVEGVTTGASLALVESQTESPLASTLTEFMAPVLVPTLRQGELQGGVAAAANFLDDIFSGPGPFTAGMENLSTFTNEGAEKIIGRMLVASGKTPDEIMRRYDELYQANPAAIPADADDTFRLWLRGLMNKSEQLQGNATRLLNARDVAQYDRIKGQLDSTFDTSFGVPGLNAEDEIARLQLATRPEISRAYRQAQAEGFGGRTSNKGQGELDLTQGFDKDVYHGTSTSSARQIEQSGFDLNRTGDNSAYFTTNPNIGEVSAAGQGAIVKRQIDESKVNLADLDMTDRYFDDQLRSMGYDGVKIPQSDGTTWYQIWNTDVLRTMPDGERFRPVPRLDGDLVGGQFSIFSPQMNKRMEVGVQNPRSSLGKARQAADQYIIDEIKAGNNISYFDVIDFTKRQMDDMVGAALARNEPNLARQITLQKKQLIEEADQMYPSYAEARQLFSERQTLEEAVRLGQTFTRSGQNALSPRDIKLFTETLGQAELRMFRLGAKDALIKRMDDQTITADSMRAIYRSRAERERLRALFQDDEVGRIQFEDFMKYMETEVEFRLTRKAAQANSTTVQQFETGTTIEEAIQFTQNLLQAPTSAIARQMEKIMTNFGRANSEQAREQAMRAAGDMLLVGGMRPERLQNMLEAGADRAVQAELVKLYYKNSPKKVAALRNATAAELVLFFREEAAREEEQERLQAQMPN